MKRFEFHLERALHVRRIQRDQERGTLEKLALERTALDHRAAAITQDRDQTAKTISQSATLEARAVMTIPNWQASVKLQLAKLAQERQQLEARIAQQQTVLREAGRRVQLLERLREKRLREWKIALDREEETFASESFLARSVRLKLRASSR